MTTFFGVVFLVFLAAALRSLHLRFRAGWDGELGPVLFVRAIDGDTLQVQCPRLSGPPFHGRVPIRIRGIDAPERATSEGETAKAFLDALLRRARRVRLVQIGREKYGRVLADVWADGRWVAQEMVSRGLAVPYSGGAR